jgi:putative ABC transport system ATP-binding protein
MNDRPAPVLEMRDVARIYATPGRPVTVLSHVSVIIRAGEFVALTGPSGSGKTTFLNLAGLLDRPTSGEILLNGQAVPALDDAVVDTLRARSIGMVFQRFNLLSRRTVIENVLFRFRYAPAPPGVDIRRLALQALEAVGLAALAGQPVRLLSGGEMQRVAIARAVALPPALLLVDEPTGNLDAVSADSVMECFRGLHARGITLVLATHNAHLLSACTRHLVCRDGRVAEADGGGP